MSTKSGAQRIEEFIAKVRAARRRQGHDLTRLQEGLVEVAASCNPVYSQNSRDELTAIQAAILIDHQWKGGFEWRISTWFDSTITRRANKGVDAYDVAVECDGQKFSCTCPTLEGAYAFMRLYQAWIVDQFYSIGPPWADTGIFKS